MGRRWKAYAARVEGRWRARLDKAVHDQPLTNHCPVCGEPIYLPSAGGHAMIRIEHHPWERVAACRRRNGTTHTWAEMQAGLRREFLERPHTYSEEMRLLEERMERGPESS